MVEDGRDDNSASDSSLGLGLTLTGWVRNDLNPPSEEFRIVDARAYITAASHLCEGQKVLRGLQKPFYFLVSQSIELSLKAVLVKFGDNNLRSPHIRHNTLALVERAKRHTTIDPLFTTAAHRLSDYHHQHLFRYGERELYIVPKARQLLDVVSRQITTFELLIFSDR